MPLHAHDVVDLSDITTGELLPLEHPGVLLREEFLDPLNVTAYRLAKAIDVPKNRITGILNGERAITADTALRLARFFGTSAEFWVNLQSRYDLDRARRAHGAEIMETVAPRDTAYG